MNISHFIAFGRHRFLETVLLFKISLNIRPELSDDSIVEELLNKVLVVIIEDVPKNLEVIIF